MSWRYAVGWLIVHGVAITDRLVQDLLTGIGTLSGREIPLSPTTDTPTPEPAQPELLPPLPAPVPYFPDGLPQHPPYIPESEMDPTITRGALDGIHGTGDYPMPTVLPPGELGPSTHDEVAPGVWMPSPSDPGPFGQAAPASTSGYGSGQAADAAESVEQSLQRQRAAVEQASQSIGDHLADAQHQSSSTAEQLTRIHEEIQLGVAALQPTLGTAAGRAELAQFLSVKTAEVRKVIAAAQRIDTRIATSLGAVASDLDAT